MRDQIARWLEILSLTKRPYTVTQYKHHLQALADSAPGKQAADWKTEDLVSYIAARRARGLGDAAIKQWVGAVRVFFAWACGLDSPARKVPYPKVRQKVQRTLDAETMLRVLSVCDTSTLKGSRDLALLTLLLDTGLRAFEVCALKLDDLEIGRRHLKVIVKGGDEREAIFSRTTASNLERWLAFRPYAASIVSTEVFVSFGGSTPGSRFTTSGLRVLFRSIGKRAGIKFSPHDLRRTMATLATRNGAPARVVQVAGRWKDGRQVETYTAAIEAEDFERYSPVESLMAQTQKTQPD